MTDISETLAPKSDQQNFDDYINGPRTVTISGVKVLKGDQQPVHVELAEYPGRPFKPNKSMRRVIAKWWGPDSSVWVGRRLTLFGNPGVSYGGKTVGGVEIAAMSHIDGPKSLPLTETRGKKKNFTVQPLREAAPQPVDLTIPADVLANIAKATADGNLPNYLDYATAQGAPKHIIDHIQASIKEA